MRSCSGRMFMWTSSLFLFDTRVLLRAVTPRDEPISVRRRQAAADCEPPDEPPDGVPPDDVPPDDVPPEEPPDVPPDDPPEPLDPPSLPPPDDFFLSSSTAFC